MKGINIDNELLLNISKIWESAFTITYEELRDYKKDIFFIVREENKILSVGRLRKRNITFLGKNYPLFGIADIVSVVKGKGFGKKLMKGIKHYLTKNKEIGLGFCCRYNSQFYKQSGYLIGKNQVKRFEFRDKGKIVRNTFDNDVIYSNRGKSLLDIITKNRKEKIYCKTRSW